LSRHLKTNRGFTLLELIIALLFSSVVLVIILAAMQLAIRSEQKGTRIQESSQHTRVLISQLSFLLQGAYPYIVKGDEKQKYYFEGEADSVSFITSSVTSRGDSLIDKPGLKWVKIYKDSGGLKIKENFFFLNEDYENGSEKERLVDDTVTAIAFEYLDNGEDGKSQPEWQSDWSTDDKEYLPAAVKASVTIKEGDHEVTFPSFTVKIQISKKKV
jgi:hypothetical protein